MKHPSIISVLSVASAIASTLSGCSTPQPDAYGSFEATEVVVSAEFPGRLVAVNITEGGHIEAGAPIAVIDTTTLPLQRAELVARRAAISARIGEANAQEGVIEAQLSIAQQEYDRTNRLLSAAAATTQQADRATRDLRTLEAQSAVVKATRATIARELATVDAQLSQLDDRVKRHTVIAPTSGTVLARYAEPGELAQPGSPVIRMAALDTMIFRAYVSEQQLSMFKLGDSVTIQVDAANHTLRQVAGRITWISAKAEFTPTPIQTREERVTQVYAVKVAVPNPDGMLRIGMPGELVLANSGQ